MEQIAENRMNTDEIDISPCKIVCRKSREKTTKKYNNVSCYKSYNAGCMKIQSLRKKLHFLHALKFGKRLQNGIKCRNS